MAYLLQFFGLSDPLQLFYLQQSSLESAGPVFTGFRPVQLDALMAWALETASCRHRAGTTEWLWLRQLERAVGHRISLAIRYALSIASQRCSQSRWLPRPITN